MSLNKYVLIQCVVPRNSAYSRLATWKISMVSFIVTQTAFFSKTFLCEFSQLFTSPPTTFCCPLKKKSSFPKIHSPPLFQTASVCYSWPTSKMKDKICDAGFEPGKGKFPPKSRLVFTLENPPHLTDREWEKDWEWKPNYVPIFRRSWKSQIKFTNFNSITIRLL